MTEAGPSKKTRIPNVIQRAQDNADLLTRLLVLGTIIILVAYSSKLILGLDQSKEYLASAFEGSLDPDRIVRDGSIRVQVAVAIATMLLQMLICVALCFNFHQRVVKLAESTGLRIWYLATMVVLIAAAWPYYVLATTIEAAYADVSKDVASTASADDLEKIKRKLSWTRAYYVGSVLICGAIALVAFFAHFRRPKIMRSVSLVLSVVAIVLGFAFFVIASYFEPASF